MKFSIYSYQNSGITVSGRILSIPANLYCQPPCRSCFRLDMAFNF